MKFIVAISNEKKILKNELLLLGRACFLETFAINNNSTCDELMISFPFLHSSGENSESTKNGVPRVLMVVDAGTVGQSEIELLSKFQQIIPLIITNETTDICKQSLNFNKNCYVYISQASLDHSLRFTAQIIRGIAQCRASKIIDLLTPGTLIDSRRVQNASDKHLCLKAVVQFISALGDDIDDQRFAQGYASSVGRMIDELILNAIFHANPRFQNSDHDEEYALSMWEAVEVKWGFDGELFFFSVTDSFGSLIEHQAITHIGTAQRNRRKNISEENTAPAETSGLGLRTVFKGTQFLFINVIHNSSTEIIGGLRFDKTLAQFAERGKIFTFNSNSPKSDSL